MVLSGEGLPGGFEEEACFGRGVGGGDESGFELAGREPDARFKQGCGGSGRRRRCLRLRRW